jgi:hypothetical protein
MPEQKLYKVARKDKFGTLAVLGPWLTKTDAQLAAAEHASGFYTWGTVHRSDYGLVFTPV